MTNHHRNATFAYAVAACVGLAAGCGGAEATTGGAYDPAALAALASPMPCASTAPTAAPMASATPAPAPPASAPPASAPASVPPPPAPAVAAVPASAFDASKPRHLLQGVVTGPGGHPVANAVVYLEDGPVEEGRGRSASIGQKGLQFFPFVAVIAHGGKVTFTNDDPFPHNVYATTPEHFDFGMMSQHASRARAFEKPGAYKLLCNLHPNMIAYVYVAPGSYFATTNGQGKYAIKDVPEGTHAIGGWAVGLTADASSATVGGGDATLDIKLHKSDTK
jgi:plastocyanin